jgi:hypothetical protein
MQLFLLFGSPAAVWIALTIIAVVTQRTAVLLFPDHALPSLARIWLHSPALPPPKLQLL